MPWDHRVGEYDSRKYVCHWCCLSNSSCGIIYLYLSITRSYSSPCRRRKCCPGAREFGAGRGLFTNE